MKFGPCECTDDKICSACHEIYILFDRTQQEIFFKLGRAMTEAVEEFRIRDRPNDPGE